MQNLAEKCQIVEGEDAKTVEIVEIAEKVENC